MNPRLHIKPDEADIERNRLVEPEGERLRAELSAWLERNRIVSIMMDTPEHIVRVDIAKLPPKTKHVLTLWGAISVRDEEYFPPRSWFLKTPREHLPQGWPLPDREESRKFEPIWDRAFKIHRAVHDFTAESKLSRSTLSTSEEEENYCDCYERAYQEYHLSYEQAKQGIERFKDIFERRPTRYLLETQRRITVTA